MKIMKSTISSILLALTLIYIQPAMSDENASARSQHIIRVATTTSTDNSGLLSYLLPEFENATGYKIQVIAVGTGKALRMGRDGDADVLLVHAPEAETEFVKAGYGVNRHAVMYNDFVLVGPASNPAHIKMDSKINEALQQIVEHKSTFISRGDNSGTHKKELSLWHAENIIPKGNWYRVVGQGMGKVLQMAAEMDAYTLTDRGTWLAYQGKSPLVILNQGDSQLYNPYHIIAVNPERYSDINIHGANALINWITSTDGQNLIGQFTLNNTVLFKPSANTKRIASQATER